MPDTPTDSAATTTTEGATMDRNDVPATYPPAEADRIFCPECERAVFYQRLHISTHEADCPPGAPDGT